MAAPGHTQCPPGTPLTGAPSPGEPVTRARPARDAGQASRPRGPSVWQRKEIPAASPSSSAPLLPPPSLRPSVSLFIRLGGSELDRTPPPISPPCGTGQNRELERDGSDEATRPWTPALHTHCPADQPGRFLCPGTRLNRAHHGSLEQLLQPTRRQGSCRWSFQVALGDSRTTCLPCNPQAVPFPPGSVWCKTPVTSILFGKEHVTFRRKV